MMRVVLLAACLLATTLAGCASSPVAVEDDPVAPIVGEASKKIYDILDVQEVMLPMPTDGKRMHMAVYLPDTPDNVTVPVFINFSPYWGDTAELGGDAFSRYMIEEYVPRGYAVILAALRGTGHSEGCFSIGGDKEVQDMHDIVDWASKQPWSNGLVATGGKSYDSSPTNGLIAKFPHPALRGVFHVSGITDMYEYNYHNGVPYTQGPIFNTYYYLQGTDEYGASLVGAGGYDDEDAESLARLIDDVACPDLPFVQAHGVGSGVTGQKSDYWQERDWAAFIGDSDWNGSIFFVHGLQDWNVKPDHILPWITELPEQIRVKGWLHQGGHVYPERTDWNATMLAWMDHELKGIDNGFWDAPRWEIRSDDDVWYQEDAWPPQPSMVMLDAVATGMPTTLLEAENDTRLSGAIQLIAAAVGQHPDPIVVATIYDVGPDGTRTWVTEAVHRMIYRNGLEQPEPWTGFGTVDMLTFPFDHVVPAGHSLQLDFDQGARVGLMVEQQRIPAMPVEVYLPISHNVPMEDQPKDMECFAC